MPDLEDSLMPVRLTVKLDASTRFITSPATSVCSFTAYMPFITPPGPNHQLLLKVCDETVVLNVSSVLHFPTKNSTECLVVLTPAVFAEYDKLLSFVDFVKSEFRTSDFSNIEDPKSYYQFYRLLVGVMSMQSVHRPSIPCSHIKLVAECCRAILAADENLKDDRGQKFSPEILLFHSLVLQQKATAPISSEFDLFEIVKTWEQTINPGGAKKWAVPLDRCIEYAKSMLVSYRLFNAGFDFSPSGTMIGLYDNYGAHRQVKSD